MAAGLYIHIPFCFSKCPYCDFYSTKYTPTAADAFAEKLGGQMQDYTGSFDTVYFGGGTPSILEPRVLTGILQAVRDHFPALAENLGPDEAGLSQAALLQRLVGLREQIRANLLPTPASQSMG